MPKSKLTWYKSDARAILNALKTVRQSTIAHELNTNQPAISYRINHSYQEMFEECLRLFKLAGYEVVESEEVEGWL